jgi:hypothetical protein
MKQKWASMIAALFICMLYGVVLPQRVAAQNQAGAAPGQASAETAPRSLWSWLKEGNISFNARFRFEGFERDGAPFTATAYAPTLRLALGYQTPAVYGFSAFAQGEAVIVTGPPCLGRGTRRLQRPDAAVAEPPKSPCHP